MLCAKSEDPQIIRNSDDSILHSSSTVNWNPMLFVVPVKMTLYNTNDL